MRKRNGYLLFFLAVFSIVAFSEAEAAVMNDYCSIPPFVSTAVPPNVMIMLSIETPMQGAMHPDQTCTGDPSDDNPPYGCSPSACRTTSGGRHISNCYDNTRDYIGYFNPSKCYTYSSGEFSVSGNASNHQCGGTAWSGNFLNWATMTALDGFRRALTGGNRDSDTSSVTRLLGARQTLDTGNSWYPMKKTTTAASYTPFSGTKWIVRHANGFSVCNAENCTVSSTGTGQTRFPTMTGATNVDAVYNLRVNVCNSAAGLESNCNTSTNKPEGLLQHYARQMRFGLFSYAMTGNANINRDGGVLRSNMKWISNKIPYGLKYHNSSGTVVDCTDANGCTNPEAEMNADGTFINNPEAVAGGNSGIVNYINKFGYANGYKSYDPISEMYYEIVRYFKNIGPSTDNYCSGLTTTTDDGFKLFCGTYNGQNWRDPYLYSCQNGVVLAINDANPWCDKRVPGTPWTAPTGGPNCTNDGGEPSNANTFTDATTGTGINVMTWTNKLGSYEFATQLPLTWNVGCVQGGSCDWANTPKTFTELGRVSGTPPYQPKQNSYYIAGLSYYAHTNDLRSDLAGTQTLTTYMIDTQESNATMLVGRKSMLFLAAKYGGFTNLNGINAQGDMVPDQTIEWDKDGDGFPDNYILASSDPSTMEQGFAKFFLDIMNRASSGTAASVLASSEGSGANILQALFYPKRPFGTQEIAWTGEMQNLWYYVDPYLQNANIREDTDTNKTLNLANDNVIQFYFDYVDNQVKVRKYEDTGGDGSPNTFLGTARLEDIKNLWEVGTIMWSRDLGTSPRTIYTTIDGSSFLSGNFSSSNAATLASYLQAADATEAGKIIGYVHGFDQVGYRSRNVTIASNTNVWKLGDIINSTPRSQSAIPLNTYHLQSPNGYLDSSYYEYINQTSYRNRGMAYVGGNDGMLHAFKTGKLVQLQGTDKARMDNPDASTPLGSEVWSFIPKNTLPYLKYLTDPNYCHLFYVDAPVFLIDASIEGNANATKTVSSWKTILIGASGLGGACRNAGASCTDCVKTPINDVGYSSYFALDVTNPDSPSLLWEFSDPSLGFSTSGPAIFRIGDSTKNGNWFVVFASGPTGPIDTTYHQYLGKSDQNLKLFILDLKTGALLRTIDTGITESFGGSLYNATLDTERGAPQASGHYSDDVLYVGYTKKSGTTWTSGGVLRMVTKESTDLADWAVSTVIDNIGPITSSIAKLQDRKRGHLWLYFGSGRFFYKMGSDIDDPDGQRTIYGLREPCYTVLNDIDNSCSDSLTVLDLTNQTSNPSSSLSTSSSGWFVNLDSTTGGYKAERVITDPLAAFNGVVFFTTFAPNGEACALGGNTYIWALKYSSGSQATDLSGKAILQVSTGEIKEFNLNTAFSDKDNRRTAAISGVPPKGQGLSVLIGPRPLQKVLHIQEK